MSRLRHPLATARGLGTSGSGREHWWMQRLTALLLIPLGLWFVMSLLRMSDASYVEWVLWFRSPFTVTLFLLTLLSVYYHALLGLQVVIEDYVPKPGQKVAILLVIKCVLLISAMSALLATISLFFQAQQAIQ